MQCPSFESTKSEKYCNVLVEISKNENSFLALVTQVLKKLDTLSIDYDSTEISKSAKLVENCKEIYFQKK